MRYLLKKGFSLLEIIIIIGIIGLICSVIVISSARQISYYSLEKTSNSVASLLEKGQNRARNSYNGVKHSVRIESSQAVLFEGTSYSAGAATNEILTYDNNINIGETSLNGGGSTITFEKVTGTTNQYGSIRFEVINASTSSSTLRIGETGIIQVQ